MYKKLKTLGLLLSLVCATNTFTVDYAGIGNKALKIVKIGTSALGGLAAGYESLMALSEAKQMVCGQGEYDVWNEDDAPTMIDKADYLLRSWIFGFMSYAMTKNLVKEVKSFNR